MALFIIEIVVEGSRDKVKILREWEPVYELFFFFMNPKLHQFSINKISTTLNLSLYSTV